MLKGRLLASNVSVHAESETVLSWYRSQAGKSVFRCTERFRSFESCCFLRSKLNLRRKSRTEVTHSGHYISIGVQLAEVTAANHSLPHERFSLGSLLGFRRINFLNLIFPPFPPGCDVTDKSLSWLFFSLLLHLFDSTLCL